VTFYKIRGTESFLDRTLAEIGVPAFDILIARTADRAIGIELTADAHAVLGPLASEFTNHVAGSASADETELEWT
jgi:hypothetical protein